MTDAQRGNPVFRLAIIASPSHAFSRRKKALLRTVKTNQIFENERDVIPQYVYSLSAQPIQLYI